MTVRRTLAIALITSVALAGLVTATGASGATPAAKVQPRAAVTNTSVLTTVKTIMTPLAPNGATGVAVNAVDDTIYVSAGTYLYKINGVTSDAVLLPFEAGVTDVAVNQVDDTVYATVSNGGSSRVYGIRGSTDDSVSSFLPGTDSPMQVAVNQVDDTVYVTRYDRSLNIFQGKNLLAGVQTINFPVSSRPTGVSVNDQDDTVYVALSANDSLSRINGVTDDSQTTAVGDAPWGVGVNQGDDTVYVMNNTSGTLSVINGATGAVSRTVPLSGSSPTTSTGVAIDQLDDTVYATATSGNLLWILNGGNLDDSTSIKMRSEPRDVAVDDTVGTGRGLVYVATGLGLEVVARATPVLNGSTTTGAAGATVTVDVSTAPTPPYGVDSFLVNSLRFNDSVTAVASPGPGAGQWSAILPSGLPPGPVTVEAVFSSSNRALAGTYTVQSSGPPTPTPVYPPGAPTDVKAAAGSGEATVSWTAPSYVGSYPITDYEVTSSSGSHTCLTKSTSCTVAGLEGGTSYTFTVRALNGAGWGAYSTPSNAVTPSAKTILITGSRDSGDDRLVKVRGTTTDLAGKQVVPYVRFPGETDFATGTGVRTVSADGTFTWQRKTGKKVYVYFEHAGVRSNTVTIAAR